MMSSSQSAVGFEDALIIGLPVMVALFFGAVPMDVVPSLVRPIIGNGFVMGVITVMLLEHVILRKR